MICDIDIIVRLRRVRKSTPVNQLLNKIVSTICCNISMIMTFIFSVNQLL